MGIQVLPLVTAAGAGLLKSAAVGATGAGLSQGALSIPGARNLLGLTVDDIARGEDYDLNDPSTYRDDIGDHVRSWFTGVSTKDVKAKAREQAIKKVNQGLRTRYDAIKTGYQTLGLKAPDEIEFQYGKGNNEGDETTAAATQRTTQRELQLKALQDAAGAGVDIRGLGNASASEIKNAKRLFDEGEAEKKQLKIFARQDQKEARLRADTLRQQMRQDAQIEANRAAQFQIQQMQFGLENRRLDMQEARNFRNDRQKAIMQIMQGFKQMGNAFAY